MTKTKPQAQQTPGPNYYAVSCGFGADHKFNTRDAAMDCYFRLEEFSPAVVAHFVMEHDDTYDSVKVFPTDFERIKRGIEPEYFVRVKRENEYRAAIAKAESHE